MGKNEMKETNLKFKITDILMRRIPSVLCKPVIKTDELKLKFILKIS